VKKLFEHFFILPFKWYKLNFKTWITAQQRCKVCGCRDKFNFNVDDEIWQKVVPEQYQNRVVCLACFDDFAKEKEVDLTTSVQELYFAGDSLNLCLKG